MAETITRVDYFYIETPNKPGEAARALNAIKESGLKLLAFSGFPKGRRAQLDFIPADSAAFAKCARKAGCTLSKKKSGFLIQGEDRIGAVADLLTKLADAKINVTSVTAVCAGGNRYGAILWVKAPDVRRAAKALGVASR